MASVPVHPSGRAFSQPSSAGADVKVIDLEFDGVDISWTLIRVFHGRGERLLSSASLSHLPAFLGTWILYVTKFWNICQADSGYHENPNVLTKHVVSRIT